MLRNRVIGGAAAVLVLAGAGLVASRGRDTSPGERAPSRTAGAAPVDLRQALRDADPSRGADLFGRCAACHPIGRDAVDRDGPNLYGVVGRRIGGRRPRYAYTAALRSVGGLWTFDRLDAWLQDPKAFAPGTTMAFAGLPDLQARADVIAYLNSQGSNLPLP